MILPFLFTFAVTFTDKVDIFTKKNVVKLKPFGFLENATFSFFVQGDQLDHVKMFLIHKNGIADRLLRKNRLGMICSQRPIFVSDLNYSTRIEGNAFSWSGIVPTKAVYTPYILNCDSEESHYTIELTYMNGDNPLDSCDQQLPSIYRFSLIFEVFFTLLFITTMIVRKEQISPIKSLFLLSQFFKFLHDFMLYNYWRNKELSDINQDPHIQNFAGLFHITTNSIILLAAQLVVDGMGLFKTSISFQQALVTIIEIAFIQLSNITFIFQNASDWLIYLSLCISFFALVFYLRDVIKSFSKLLDIQEILYTFDSFYTMSCRSIIYTLTTVSFLCLSILMILMKTIIGLRSQSSVAKMNASVFVIQMHSS